ncbi:MAG TPA: isoprenylcysteine carboxylmethyltransferase family protein [Bacteroidales bacterium]|nr:isoprenylcysteine carboxylmethyltransferase family protein [Bacteroidales bacterium]HPS17567.1 isoprenylcysteine carboxylmethyltransferase family protein [Bacteroidales bacterium]
MKTFRLILGYIIGFSMFCIFIPYLLIVGSNNPWPFPELNFIPNIYLRSIIAFPIFCIGLLFAIWSNIFLLTKGEGGPVDVFNVAISPRSIKLVVTGPYKFSRNPMVFGALSIYFSISVFVNSLYDIIIILLIIPLAILYLKLTEEKRLIKDFGEEYLLYRSKVPMIVPFTKIRKRTTT